ncbi:pachytene checkpoint protein 2 homolog [Copidosoma floridanum]|uniref:pachytene checkpoint protein 2 homolog n=1 Tax=Copidosoma floridanum TaxID=29053 RepID=UPI0006C94399|nr:pachytene checkpoint protein 2 homolog [Copidosoma floridanum]
MVLQELKSRDDIFVNRTLTIESFSPKLSSTKKHIKCLYFSIGRDDSVSVKLSQVNSCHFFVYRLNEDEAAMETIDKDGEEISTSTHWILPSKEFHGLWETLFYGDNIKDHLLNFVETAMLYSQKQVNTHIISWNKVVLLHGPPGTGKTSLCKALAQKVSVRLNNRFQRTELIEINSHSLFSKWFSESGKLVMNLFNEIKQLLEDSTVLVCVLIDEVESLAHARNSCANGTEPSDSIRVVNALLTQLDNLKRHPNVLILTTSNLTESIDVAFVDRADIKQFIPEPNVIAIYQIYFGCIQELMRTNLILLEEVLDVAIVQLLMQQTNENMRYFDAGPLFPIAENSVGLSGRMLRKIPFLTHARYFIPTPCSLNVFLHYMELTVQKELQSRKKC